MTRRLLRALLRAFPRDFLRCARAEAVKEARLHWGQRTNVVVEALVPALHFAMAWLMFTPFDPSGRVAVTGSESDDALLLFLLTGFLGYYVLQRLLWAAMDRAYREREGSTIELVLLTPASRLGLLVGGAVSGMLRATWLYVAFLAGTTLFGRGWHVAHAGAIVVALLALVIPALAFGTLLQGFLLFARDTSAYVSLLQPPLSFLAGVRFPVSYLPGVLQVVSSLLPLTWSLRAARPLLIEGATIRSVLPELAVIALVTATCLALAQVVSSRAEALAKREGSMTLY